MSQSAPAVSITVAAYNAEQWIAACLTSIARQSEPGFECIVVDDCSTDTTPDLIETFARKDHRFSLVRHAVNQGLAATRKTGLANCIGEFIWQIDGDDYLADDALETFLAIARRDQCDIVRAGFMIDKDGTFSKGWQRAWGNICNATFPRLHFLHAGPNGLVLNFCRRDFISQLDFADAPRVDLGEDFVFNARAYANMQTMSLTDKAVYYYRRHGQSYTSGNTGQRRYLDEARAHAFVFDEWQKWPAAQMIFSIALSRFRLDKIAEAARALPENQVLQIIEAYKRVYRRWDPELCYALAHKAVRIRWTPESQPDTMELANALHQLPAADVLDRLKQAA